MFSMSHLLEINVFKGSTAPQDLSGIGTFAMKHGIQAIVSDPDFIQVLFTDRLRLGCLNRYKIICAVDFDRGANFALAKLRSLPSYALSADGFDILLSAKRPDKESYNELKVIDEFIHNLDQLKEIRWSLDFRSRSHADMASCMPYLIKFPAQFLRTGGAYLQTEVSLDSHLDDIQYIRKSVGTPIKVGGNLNLSTIIALKNRAARFDVTMTQARRILKAADAADSAVENPKQKEVEKVIVDSLDGPYSVGVDLAGPSGDKTVTTVITKENGLIEQVEENE